MTIKIPAIFQTTEGIVVLSLLCAILFFVLLLVPVLYVTLRKCGVIKVGRVAVTTDQGCSSVWITGKHQRTQTELTGEDVDRLQQRTKARLADYQGKQLLTNATKKHNSVSPENGEFVFSAGNFGSAYRTTERERTLTPSILPRWQKVDPDWSDPWTHDYPVQYGYVRRADQQQGRQQRNVLTTTSTTTTNPERVLGYFRAVR